MIRYLGSDVIDSDVDKVEAVCMECFQMPSASNRFALATFEEAREENYDENVTFRIVKVLRMDSDNCHFKQ